MHVIRSNTAKGTADPPITVKTYKGNTRANSVVIRDNDGNEVAKIIYSPEKPLSCGARLWIECDSKNVVVE